MRATGAKPVRPGKSALAALAAILTALGGTEAAAQVAFGGPVPGPLEFAALELRSAEGFSGGLELLAVLSDGSKLAVFSADGLPWTRVVEARFFAPELIVGLELRDAETGAALHGATGADRSGEAPEARAARARLRALPFPIRGPAGGTPPALHRFEGMDAARAARFATARLFLRQPRRQAVIALAAWTFAAALAAGIVTGSGPGGDRARGGRGDGSVPGGDRAENGDRAGREPRAMDSPRRRAIAVALALACLAVTALAAFLAAPEPLAWSLELPGEGEAASFEARLGETAPGGDGRSLAWTTDGSGKLAFLSFHAPGGEGIPITARPGELYRFSSPPRVTLGPDGVYRLSAERFLMAWSFRP